MAKIKYTYEEFLEKVKERELEILEGEYVDCTSRFLIKSKEGYICNVKPIALIMDRETRYFHPANKYALENIRTFLKNNNMEYKLITERYVKATDKLEFFCKEHGNFKRTSKEIRNKLGCPMCSKYRRKTNEEINEKLKNIGWEWIDGEYVDAQSKIIIENKEGYKSTMIIASLFQDVMPTIFYDTNPFTIDNIKRYLEIHNLKIKLKSETYRSSRESLIFECEEHGDFEMSWTNFGRNGNKCPKCKGSYVYTLDEVKDMLKEINRSIEILYETRNTCDGKRGFVCKCLVDGHKWTTSFTDLITKGCGCRKCSYREMSGKNHYNYNHAKSEEERLIKREYTEYYKWREEVYKRDNYICQCCGYDKGGKLNAHHLNGYNWDIEHRTDVDNGISLCFDCHEAFHKQYGYGYNTKEQYEEWIQKIKNNKYNEAS